MVEGDVRGAGGNGGDVRGVGGGDAMGVGVGVGLGMSVGGIAIDMMGLGLVGAAAVGVCRWFGETGGWLG